MACFKKSFSATLQRSDQKGAWTYVVMPGSAQFLGTAGRVKVRGSINGHSFRSAFMATGDGTHMLPVKADTRNAIGKDVGDRVVVLLQERLSRVRG